MKEGEGRKGEGEKEKEREDRGGERGSRRRERIEEAKGVKYTICWNKG